MSQQIPLSRGRVALVDDCDHEYLSQFKWTYDSNGYAIRMESTRDNDGKRHRRKVLMHRLILGEPAGVRIDHRNRNRLDNRRSNLRLATQSQNNANTLARPGSSIYKGVYLHASGKASAPSEAGSGGRKIWRAIIEVNGIKRHLGCFRSEDDAASAYNLAALAAWGEYACLNLISI